MGAFSGFYFLGLKMEIPIISKHKIKHFAIPIELKMDVSDEQPAQMNPIIN